MCASDDMSEDVLDAVEKGQDGKGGESPTVKM